MIKVLLADDVEELRTLLRVMLSTEDNLSVVGEAANGKEAVEQVGITKPDVILLDVAMPVMDGLQAAQEIRVLMPDIKIIMLSGFKEEEFAQQAKDCGADKYLEKGMAVSNIIQHVIEVMKTDDADKKQ